MADFWTFLQTKINHWTWTDTLLGLVMFLVIFFGSLAVVAWVMVKLPATYFHKDHPPAFFWAERHPVLRWTARIVKNIIGVGLIGIGFVLLFGPGQGLLTMLIGVMLLDFPGKRRLERTMVGRPALLRAINRLRERFGKPPLVLDDEKSEPEA